MSLRQAEELVRFGAYFFGQDDEKLFAAARSEKHLRKSEFRDNRAREHFTEKAKPLRPAGKIELISRTGKQKRLGAKNLTLQENLNRHARDESTNVARLRCLSTRNRLAPPAQIRATFPPAHRSRPSGESKYSGIAPGCCDSVEQAAPPQDAAGSARPACKPWGPSILCDCAITRHSERR